MTYDIVIFTDVSSNREIQRGLGAYKIAHEARQLGFSAVVIDYSSAINFDRFKLIIDKTVGDNTIAVGFSNTWFPYRTFNQYHVTGALETGVTADAWDFENEYLNSDTHLNSLSMNFAQNKSKKYVDYIKSINANCDCIIGGAKSFEYLQSPEFDKVFVGYSENHFRDYLQGKHKDQRIVHYDMKSKLGDFDFNSSYVTYMDTDCIHSEEILTIEMSRGCIFNCKFCSYPHRNQKTKDFTKYQDVLYKELKDNYDKWGTYKYYITDDTFNDYTTKLEVIKEVIQSLDFNPQFEAYVRQDLVARQPQQAKLMYDIGIRTTYYGLETWHDPTAKAIGKGGDLQMKIQGMKNCRDAWGDDVYVSTGIVVGLPKDTEQSIRDVLKWYKWEGGNEYIDNLHFNALIIKNKPEAMAFLFNSDIDLHPEKYGYKMNGMLDWTRSGEGDINTFAKAQKLADTANTYCQNVNKFPPKVWDPFSIYTAVCSHIPEDNLAERFFYYTENYYFPQLMDKING